MSRLVNRKPSSRVDCLHALMKVLNGRFSVTDSFSMSDAKFDPKSLNVFSTCQLLIKHPLHNFLYCPYKQNPLDPAACGLTNSVVSDSTKQKEVSNTLSSLEGLGFLDRLEDRKFRITKLGQSFAQAELDSIELTKIFRKGCSNYGPFVGILAQLIDPSFRTINTDSLRVGYPQTVETVMVEGSLVNLSIDSATDSNVRTKSTLLQWAIATGFLFDPRAGISENPQTLNRESLNANSRAFRKLSINRDLVEEFFSDVDVVSRPLDYENLTKNVGSLRENGQAIQRQFTLKFDAIVKNRRLAICWALNSAAIKGEELSISWLDEWLRKYPELFIIDSKNFSSVLREELLVGFTVGIPFEAVDDDRVSPLKTIDLEVLGYGAPTETIELLVGEL